MHISPGDIFSVSTENGDFRVLALNTEDGVNWCCTVLDMDLDKPFVVVSESDLETLELQSPIG